MVFVYYFVFHTSKFISNCPGMGLCLFTCFFGLLASKCGHLSCVTASAAFSLGLWSSPATICINISLQIPQALFGHPSLRCKLPFQHSWQLLNSQRSASLPFENKIACTRFILPYTICRLCLLGKRHGVACALLSHSEALYFGRPALCCMDRPGHRKTVRRARTFHTSGGLSSPAV